jgi:LytTr DNA-binding domain
VKSVRQFATSPRLVITLVVILVAVLAGPFQTGELSLGARLLFWSLLIGLNMIKWQIWVARIGARAGDGWQASAVLVLGGAILLNLTLPFEINLAYRLVGQTTRIPWAPLFTMSLLISLGIGAAIAVAYRPAVAPVAAAPPEVSDAAPVTPPASGLALRANIASLGDIGAIVAEDHYLRLWLADGRSPLVLYRFGDAVRDLAGVDGVQVHRGAWVAASAVAGAVRDGRRWRLLLASGESVPVSESFLPEVRARGWLKPRNSPNGSGGRLNSGGAASRTAAPSGPAVTGTTDRIDS